MTRSEHARSLRETAVRLLEAAADIEDGPGRTIDTTRATGCTCNVCGDHITGPRWVGDPCEATVAGVPCRGRYHLDPEPRYTDCERHLAPPNPVHLDPSKPCTCHEPVRLSDGRTLPVTVDALAMSQAAMDAAADEFLAADDDMDSLDRLALELDIASTYRGGRAG